MDWMLGQYWDVPQTYLACEPLALSILLPGEALSKSSAG